MNALRVAFTATTTTHYLTEPVTLTLFGGGPAEVTAIRTRPEESSTFGYDVQVLARPKRSSTSRWAILYADDDERVLAALGLIAATVGGRPEGTCEHGTLLTASHCQGCDDVRDGIEPARTSHDPEEDSR